MGTGGCGALLHDARRNWRGVEVVATPSGQLCSAKISEVRGGDQRSCRGAVLAGGDGRAVAPSFGGRRRHDYNHSRRKKVGFGGGDLLGRTVRWRMLYWCQPAEAGNG